VRVLKVKLGSPAGISADQAMLMAVRERLHQRYMLMLMGLEFEEAIAMCNWLASVGVKYVEQPLPREKSLLELKKRSPLPIFVDESCLTSCDIPQPADRGIISN